MKEISFHQTKQFLWKKIIKVREVSKEEGTIDKNYKQFDDYLIALHQFKSYDS